MNYLDPNTPLRIAYVQALTTSLGIPGWAKKVPKNVSIPSLYFLIHSQTLNPTERCKDHFEWLCSIVVDIIFTGPAGYASPVQTETKEGLTITAIENGIVVAGFDVKSIRFISSINLDEETPTQSIERRVITYQHWLCQA